MIIHDVFEKKQMILNFKIMDLLQMLSDQRLTIRRQNKEQIRMIRNYILDNLPTQQVYLPPLVAYTDETLEDGRPPTRLHLIDGTQRLQAFVELDAYVNRSFMSEDEEEQKKVIHLMYRFEALEIAVQVYEGMGEDEASQLFVDLNTKGKKVALSKRIAYDSRSSINQITNRLLQQHTMLREAGVDEEKVAIVRPNNKHLLSLSQLRRIIGYFMAGKTISSRLSMDVESIMSEEENIALISTWFDELFSLYPADSIGDYEVSMLAGFPLLYAVAVYATDGLEELSFDEKQAEVVRRMRKLAKVDWSRNQEDWLDFNGRFRGKENYFYLSSDKRNIEALVAWLTRKGGE
ncbi:DNA sulfur modification protein DndB [Sporosarcina sp. 179-K 3D1 HS]|uniref:DNA sulfur modification protein DndB n=1 Tax=Sporosarcina sp. 179-K 3D1 HS TaxID=3232169 RepID=UPI0039A31EA7